MNVSPLQNSPSKPALNHNGHPQGPFRQHVYSASRSAPLWYAISFPQFLNNESTESQNYLQELAEPVRQLSSRISLLPPDCIVFEIRSSLRYFGGVASIRKQLLKSLGPLLHNRGLNENFHQAVTPTATSSILLARNGANILIYQIANLRSALGQLPLASLPISPKKKEQLKKTGLTFLRDVWRLPGAGLRQRFGKEFVNYLNRCLGKTADSLKIFEPPPVFRSRQELEYPLENTTRLFLVIAELLEQLCDFLQQRELCTTHLFLEIQHEQQAPTVIEMNLRRASRSRAHLLLLLENRCSALTLCSPATAITLTAKYFEAFIAENAGLLVDESEKAANTQGIQLVDLLEQLQARLGNTAVRTLQAFPEHCPEYASAHFSYAEAPGKVDIQAPGILRPCWLLDAPQPFSPDPLRIISEPERIETHWWAGPDIRRDYYVAHNNHGQLLWIFNLRSQNSAWYLHGIF